MLENRRHFRLREFMDVTWKVDGAPDIFGEGIVTNISLSGLLLQTDKMFKPTDNCILAIGEGQGDQMLPFTLKKGKIVWFRRINTPHERLQCGIRFLGEHADGNFQQWMEMKVNRLSQAADANILNNFAF